MAQKNINHLICYAVLDSTNHIVKKFDNYQDALYYKLCIAGRPDWTIKKSKETLSFYRKTKKFCQNYRILFKYTFCR